MAYNRRMTADAGASTLKLIGDLRAATREARAFDRAIDAFLARHPNIHEDYPDQWIAVHGDVVLANGDLGELLGELDRRGIPRERTHVRFVEREPRALIL